MSPSKLDGILLGRRHGDKQRTRLGFLPAECDIGRVFQNLDSTWGVVSRRPRVYACAGPSVILSVGPAFNNLSSLEARSLSS